MNKKISAKRITGIIFSVIFIAAFLFGLVWAIINWETVKQSFSGTQLYTAEQVEQIKEDTYNEALKDKDSYLELINNLRDEKINLTDELSQAKIDITSLQNANKEYQTSVETLTAEKEFLTGEVTNLTAVKIENEQTISNLTTDIENYEIQISNLNLDIENNQNTISQLENQITLIEQEIASLQDINEDNEATISELTQQKSDFETQIINLNAQISSKTQEINTLNSTITSLNNMVAKLQSTNDIQAQTIENLNSQIVSLNSQISNLTFQINNNSGLVSSLNFKIAQLENTIAYYEEYIAGLENGTQIVVTFEFNGSVYNVQVINKGSKLSLVEPTSTEYVIFNYWQLEDGTRIDLNTYTFEKSTKVIANITYKYNVNFYVDNSSINEQIIIKDGYSVEPENPVKSGYDFDGWSLDGKTVINVSETKITKNTIFYAVFTKLYTVEFNDGTSIINSQTVRNGEFANNVDIEDTTYKIFNGWLYNNSLVNVPTFAISSDTVFIASYTYKYDVTFKVEEQTHNSQIIASGNFASEPTAPTKTGYTFKGWSLDGQNIVNLNSTPITATTTFIAIFEINTYTVTFDTGDTNTTTTQQVTYNSSPSEPATPIKDGYEFEYWTLNKENMVNVTDIAITDNTTFYAVFSYYDFVATTWNGLENLNGRYVWTANDNVYYSNSTNQYVLNKETNTWSSISWTILDTVTIFDSSNVWTDNLNYYYTAGINTYKINFETFELEKISSSTGISNFRATDVWTDGINTYYSRGYSNHYVLNKETFTWEAKTWNGNYEDVFGSEIVNVGEEIYNFGGAYSNFKLNKQTETWEASGFISGIGSIAITGIVPYLNNVYYVYQNNLLLLDLEAQNYKVITNLSTLDTSLNNECFWCSADNMYYSRGPNQYILTKIFVYCE